MAHVIISPDVKSEKDAAAFWKDFTLSGCVDSVLTVTPHKHFGLGWFCTVAFLTSERPDKWLDRLRGCGRVLCAAVDEVCGPVRPYELKSDQAQGWFYEQRWPQVEGLIFC